VCSAHHRAIHRGELIVEGSVSCGLCFRHADGAEYGGVVLAATVDAQARAFRGLRQMGFGEGEVRRALAQVSTHVGHQASVEVILRSALRLLTDGAFARAS
jgi:hypothetical protein